MQHTVDDGLSITTTRPWQPPNGLPRMGQSHLWRVGPEPPPLNMEAEMVREAFEYVRESYSVHAWKPEDTQDLRVKATIVAQVRGVICFQAA